MLQMHSAKEACLEVKIYDTIFSDKKCNVSQATCVAKRLSILERILKKHLEIVLNTLLQKYFENTSTK